MTQASMFECAEFAHDPGCKRPIKLQAGIEPAAVFGGSGDCYRYRLLHRWAPGPLVLFVMKNPSAASLVYTDATVSKCGRLARRWSFGGLMVGNVCAYRSTDQNGLLTVDDPVGPENISHVLGMADEAELIIVAHGKLPGNLQPHADAMVERLRAHGHDLCVLRLQSGIPIHPLARGRCHVPEEISPVVWV